MSATPTSCTVERFTTSDGYTFSYRHYPAQGPTRGQLVYVHGIQSHGGWYGASCQHLAAAGWEVAFLDRRGSGLNEERRGDAPSCRRLVADLDEFIGHWCRRPPMLAAVSWGGKLAVALEYFFPGRTTGLALLTPGLCPQVRPSLGQRLRIACARLVAPTRQFPIPLDDPELFTATPHWQSYIRDDPLSLRTATARFLVESVRLDFILRRAPRHVRVPVLLLLAGKDRIIDNRRTRAYLARFASSDRLVLEYPEAHHTLEFEPAPTPIFADLTGWLARRAKSHCPA